MWSKEGHTQKQQPWDCDPRPPDFSLSWGWGMLTPSGEVTGGCEQTSGARGVLCPHSSRNAAGVSKHGVSTGTLPGRVRSPPGSPPRDSPSLPRRAASAPTRSLPPGVADLAASSSSAKPLCGVLHPRGQGASWAQRTRPTLLGSRGMAAGHPQQGLRQACPPGLVYLRRRSGGRDSASFPLPRPGPRRGGRPGSGGPRLSAFVAGAGFLFCFEAGRGGRAAPCQ